MNSVVGAQANQAVWDLYQDIVEPENQNNIVSKRILQSKIKEWTGFFRHGNQNLIMV